MKAVILLVCLFVGITTSRAQILARKWKIQSMVINSDNNVMTLYHRDSVRNKLPFLRPVEVEYFSNNTYRAINSLNIVDSGNWRQINSSLILIDGDTVSYSFRSESNLIYEELIPTYRLSGDMILGKLITSFIPSDICNYNITLKSGVWNDPEIWYCGRVPLITDIVQLNHVVTVPQGYAAKAQRLIHGFDSFLKMSNKSTLLLAK